MRIERIYGLTLEADTEKGTITIAEISSNNIHLGDNDYGLSKDIDKEALKNSVLNRATYLVMDNKVVEIIPEEE